jgi:hypothetical protein
MRVPPKAKKAIEIVEKLQETLEFYMGDTEEFNSLKMQDIRYLKDYLLKISEEKKLNDIKLAVKIKKEMKDDGDN